MTDTKPLRPAIFADRDGTLIEEVNYLSRVEDLALFPTTRQAIVDLKQAGYAIVVITNQSGIGRGIYSEAAMRAIHDQMQADLDGMIDGFYFCPHLPCDGCECRKPGTKMFKDAERDLAIDLSTSWMVGDKDSDVAAGVNAGLQTCLVSTGYGMKHKVNVDTEVTICAADFGQFVRHLLAETVELAAAEVIL